MPPRPLRLLSLRLQTADPVGEWLVKDGSARIKVVSCPQAQNQPPTLWGVIWAEMKASRDTANPDPSMKNRPMVGVPILIGMKQTQANRWDGKIYDARGGSIYDANVTLNRNDMLEVRGCVASIFCGGEDWKRVTGTNTPPLPEPALAPATPAPQAKGGAMAPSGQTPSGQTKGSAMMAPAPAGQTKGAAMAKSNPAALPPADPICSNISSLVPRT